MAHDFNNLLTVMALNIELAAMEMEGREEVTGYLEEARRAAMTASGLTQQLYHVCRWCTSGKERSLPARSVEGVDSLCFAGLSIDLRFPPERRSVGHIGRRWPDRTGDQGHSDECTGGYDWMQGS